MSINPIDFQPVARKTDPHTSHESAAASEETHKNIAEHVLRIAADRGGHGLTINEATEALPQFKPWSVSPVFKPLVRQGKLVRHVVGKTGKGKDRYETRIDPESSRPVIVHYYFRMVQDRKTEESFVRKPTLGTAGAKDATLRSAERRLGERRRRNRRKSG
jgi:hypothetical protein